MQISVTRALSEIKMLDKRITEKTNTSTFLGITRGRDDQIKVVGSNNTVDHVSNKISSEYQSLTDLIVRRRYLKSLVAASNAKTTVEIQGISYVVQDVIESKSSIKYDLDIHQRMMQQYRASITECERQNIALNQKIETAVAQAYGNEKGKVTEEQYNAVAKPRLDEGQYNLIDPLKLEDLITKKADQLNGFLMEVDFALSESNARTMIEVGDHVPVV